MDIFKSASKIVFILLAIVSCAGFLLGMLDPKDFMMLVSMSFSFYFSNKPTDKNGEITK